MNVLPKKCLWLLLLSAAAAGAVTRPRSYYVQLAEDGGYTIVKSDTNKPHRFVKQKEAGILAKSLISQDINETGWAYLEVHTNDAYSDIVQAYTAGYIEGALTQELTYMHWYNTLGDYCSGRQDLCDKIDQFLEGNQNYIQQMIKKYSSTDKYWYQVNLFYKQLEGLVDGYNHANKNKATALTYKNLLWLNIQGDFEDLEQIFQSADEFNLETSKKVMGDGHCSALVKLLEDGTEMFVSQVTWSSYQSMLRYQKKYSLPYKMSSNQSETVPATSMTFSSYPGVLTSGDDFYLTSAGLVTLETTIGNSNSSLWTFILKENVLEGVRSMVANRLATSGQNWADIFARFNSGTYNNQWMIVDYKKFKTGTLAPDLQNNLLWVVEQIPGYVYAADRTKVLRQQSYWPSYNVASFKEVFQLSGNQELVEKFGDWFTYDKNPRALIFQRDHGKVTSLASMLALMRYNDFQHDHLSRCNCTPPYSAENAISARCDLNPANGTYPFGALGHRNHGATDAKITSTSMFHDGLKFLAVSGPVFNESLGLPPFQWSKSDFNDNTPHLGHPDLWMFEPLIHQWA